MRAVFINARKYAGSQAIFFLVSASFLGLLAITWLKWGDVIIDTFRDLWVPLQMINGRALYKDIFYEYGFMPPYILAIIYRLLVVPF